MIKENIALFKRFIIGRGLDTIYTSFYYDDIKNKMPLEEFLLIVDEKEVLANAFYIKGDETNTSPFRKRSYWLDMQQKFDDECRHAGNNGWYSAWNVKNINKWLKAPIGIMAQKQAEAKRKKMEAEKKKAEAPKVEEPTPAPPTPATPTPPQPNAEIQEEHNKKDKMGMKGTSPFKFFDLKHHSPAKQQGMNELQVSNKEGSTYRVTFSKKHSAEIIESGLRYMAIGQDEYTSAVRIVFNDEGGLEYPQSCLGKNSVVINSRALTKLLSELFDMEEDSYTLNISDNLAHSKKYLTYQITKKQ